MNNANRVMLGLAGDVDATVNALAEAGLLSADAAATATMTVADRARAALSNRYVQGGLAAVGVAAAAYGTYRVIKHYNNKPKSAKKVEFPPMTAEQKIEYARKMLDEGSAELEARLQKAGGVIVQAS